MRAMSRILGQIREALTAFAGSKADPALIGGLALAAHRVIRATQDVDFLVDADEADRLHDVIIGLGYSCIHRSDDVANYVRYFQLFDREDLLDELLAEAGRG